MLRKITIGCAVVVAMLAAPATLPAHSMGGFGGMHSSGGMHSFGGMHSSGGMHSFGMASRSAGVHAFSHRANFPRHASLILPTFITSGTTSHTFISSTIDTCSPPLSASATAVAGGGCQRDSVGTGCGFAIPIIE